MLSPVQPTSGARAAGRPAGQLLRSYRLPAAVVVLLLAAAVVLAVANRSERTGSLDPAATDPAGSKAIAVLLGDRGVQVERTVGTGEALDRVSPAGGTVLITQPDVLPTATRQRLAGLGPAVRIVLVSPGPDLLSELRTSVSLTPAAALPVQTRAAGCELAAARVAGSARTGGVHYDGGEQRCYDRTLVTGRTASGAELVVLGSGDLLTNDSLGADGDAALALGLLDAHRTLAWALPGGSDVAGSGGTRSLRELLPAWVVPIALWLLVMIAVVALWRGRRFGRLVAEPLPVVVRAAEVVEGRGRLYRRARARDSAAAALQQAARHALLPSLGLGRTADAGDDERSPGAVVQAVAVRTGWSADLVGTLLYGPAPGTDEELVGLATRLDRLVAATTTDRRTREGSL